ncbi:hypothetical protein Q4561_02525 [Alteromonas sp. 1_MG-2023]|uniref:hypothetical protein n=1 Tax=Alteromonas sp. 1_MG-2023 TaxID=3062669 RepID=UPI0026E14DF7|nr:hypothetical protein [Alteromonas sp. 1_MG-2023]MDO6565925.1 hypothetical protein [Alteromonas sp. 1_MG-2023]
MKKIALLIPLIITGCAGMPDYVEPKSTTPSATLKVTNDFDAPLLGYSTFVHTHTETETCGKSFGAESGARLIVLDKGNPLISELNPDGVKLSAGRKYSFMIMSVAGMQNCIIYASFSPEADQNYEIKTFGKLRSYDNSCEAALFRYDELNEAYTSIDFEYYGQCK